MAPRPADGADSAPAPGTDGAGAGSGVLSKREWEVAELVAKGHTSKETAAWLTGRRTTAPDLRGPFGSDLRGPFG
ncbi:regulatory protein LuxR [Actinobacteria bacterium OK074]|nr:regulatory protein LuxR [Actinobacteria bacterium OK074]